MLTARGQVGGARRDAGAWRRALGKDGLEVLVGIVGGIDRAVAHSRSDAKAAYLATDSPTKVGE